MIALAVFIAGCGLGYYAGRLTAARQLRRALRARQPPRAP